MKRKLSMLLALGMVCSTVFAGTASATTIDDLEAEASTEEAEAAEAAELADEQEITFVLSNEPDGIDPNVTNNSFAVPFLENCFVGLVTYDSDGEIIPGEAESWEINDDLTEFTFHLRDGLKWSDGSDHTAQDYVYSALRVLSPETAGMYVDMLTAYIVNAEEYYNGEAEAEDVGVTAVDDTTLVFDLVDSCPFFIDLVSMWCYDPVQEATIEANGDKWTASADTYICNGPFKITEMNMGESMILEKNEYYYDADSVTLEKINFRYIMDTSTALTAYENGEVDGVRTIASSDLARLQAEDAGVKTSPSYGTVYYNFNCAVEPYDDPLVRKALNLAIDRDALINNVAQLDAEPAYSLLSPGYVVDGTDITEGRSDYGLSSTADVEGALEALEEAGYPNGEGFPTIQLSYYSDDNVKLIAEAIAEMWETNLGVEVEITSADWAVFYDAVQSGDYEVAAMGWSADYLNPMSFLPLLYTDDTDNTVFYSNPDYDAVVDQIKTEQDPEKFAELVMEADEISSNDYPLLNLYYKSNNYLLKDYVEGVYMISSGSYFFKDACVVAH